MNRGVLTVRFWAIFFFCVLLTLDIGSITFRSNLCDHMFGCILPAVETILHRLKIPTLSLSLSLFLSVLVCIK